MSNLCDRCKLEVQGIDVDSIDQLERGEGTIHDLITPLSAAHSYCNATKDEMIREGLQDIRNGRVVVKGCFAQYVSESQALFPGKAKETEFKLVAVERDLNPYYDDTFDIKLYEHKNGE